MNQKNKTTEELLFEDFILHFFGFGRFAPYSTYPREAILRMLGDAFPAKEVCHPIREKYVTRSCGCCSDAEYSSANYIEDY